MSTLQTKALFEHRFWLQILGDHVRFILLSLAPMETEEIRRAHYFAYSFDRLLESARKEIFGEELADMNRRAYKHTNELRDFKLHLIVRHLTGKIHILLSPSFLNHMVNELEEYLRILQCLNEGKEPPVCDSLHHHLLWLLDASGHATAIKEGLDETEKQLKEKSGRFGRDFDDLYMKAVKLAGYLRTRLREFPALTRFNQQVELEIVMFRQFLQEIEEMELDQRSLSTLSPLFPDHMLREECYYLKKLAEVSELEEPSCDPSRPRGHDVLKVTC